MIDKWGRLLNIWKTSLHQAQREGISHDHVNEIAGGGKMIRSDVSAKVEGLSNWTKVQYNVFLKDNINKFIKYR